VGNTAEVIPLPEDEFDIGSYENVADAIGGIFVQHPMRQDELSDILKHTQSAISRHLAFCDPPGWYWQNIKGKMFITAWQIKND
jgi:hypothetical protein